MVFWGDTLVVGWRDRARLRHTIHSDRDPAHQQAVAQPGTGPAVSRSGAAARTLGKTACRAQRPQRFGAAPFPVFGNLQEGYLRT